ncbi:ATP-binding cassette domain-containing protein [Candidatus Saccharibacteria bacterium]|nr:ABC transporter ATP-binding protein [Candidatus Saccharibacteria bacterium]NIV03515.1 ATP-binding cassette domain-containing protein [Calditrichia bacterium]NIS38060.1 ABC transporter ATP-binding protein [Candidatus Saccharibacteria bacterium]NIV71757.1 ATP-binding cassette domain-containing protein [Calditrichia bacterium]NIV98455.1 ATP-binding cassette domain-containing protein [Candidatus Saccharibacteria bacterium]
MDDNAPLISIRDIKKDYVNEEVVTKVLHGISFDIHKGEFLAIMGPSGSGKSTLMHILGFLDRPTSGDFFFNGRDVSKLTDDDLAEMRSSEVGFVFQAFFLLPRTTVYENVMLPLVYTKFSQKERDEMTREAIDAVGLTHRMNHTSNQLSGGEKQRVAIARAIVNRPSVVFADEPTGNLDSRSGQQVMEELEDLNDRGRTIILVTHEKYTAEHAERIIYIKDGLVTSDTRVENRLRAKDGELVK